uniref:Uncharacterized protein n=1 Tax=Coccolithus braarudii TaxID=221442 RepID=A0A7S0LP02_9EUKA
MFSGDHNDLAGAIAPQRVGVMNYAFSDNVGLSSMCMLGKDQSQCQAGLAYQTRAGVLKAEMVSPGVLQTSLEGFSPLPFMQITTQAAFVQHGLAMGAAHAMLMTPVGYLMGAANLMGQLSGELVAALPIEDQQIMLGVHMWGLPGAWGGVKAALEWTKPVLDEQGEFTGKLSSVTLACTRPHKASESGPSWSLSAASRLSASDSLLTSFERTPRGNHVLCMGGSREIRPGLRLRGKWSTTGVLGMALEMPADKGSLTLSIETAPSRDPKFGATVQISG